MASLYTAAIQRDAALAVFGRANSDLSASEKLALDNTWTAGTPGGAAGYALDEIARYANFLFASGADNIPNDWARWAVYEIALSLAPQWNPQLVGPYGELRDQYKQAALTTYSRIYSNDDTESDSQVNKTWLGMRRAIMSSCMNQPRAIFAAPELIDGALREAFYRVWYHAEWSWQVFTDQTFDITNAGGNLQTINTTPDLRSIRSGKLYNNSTTSTDRNYMTYCSADKMARELANNTTAGFPELFRLVSAGREIKIQLDRVPDKTYTMRGEFVRRPPDLGAIEASDYSISNEDFDTGLDLLPDEFTGVIQRLALADILIDRGRGEGRMIKQDAEEDLDRLVAVDAKGDPQHHDMRNRTRDLVRESQVQGGFAQGGRL